MQRGVSRFRRSRLPPFPVTSRNQSSSEIPHDIGELGRHGAQIDAQPHSNYRKVSQIQHGDSWREPLDLVEATPLSPIPEVRAAMQPSDVSPLSPDPLDGRASPPHDDTDHVSIIASDDGSESMDDGSNSDSGDSEDLDMLLNFENMMFNAGELHDPVVNVWYDLDVVEEIVDPVHFLADVKRLRMCVLISIFLYYTS